MYHSFLIHPSADGHLGCFLKLCFVMEKTKIGNKHTHVSIHTHIHIYLQYLYMQLIRGLIREHLGPYVGKLGNARYMLPIIVICKLHLL